MTLIKIFMLSQYGDPGTCACGGSFGQSEEQIQALHYALEEAFDCQVDSIVKSRCMISADEVTCKGIA
ncbi:hypothetical protein U27_03653 [Candidatus Vecturithrix granuli]|uniref:Uncharacterized protein n=1 Tax=Vecturithrix granuli TaxID=1499967 RepID=A0A081BWI5_VECG1|nr:hypothetical protein U27_03653 [Candidatus Vecturithrix granuli]